MSLGIEAAEPEAAQPPSGRRTRHSLAIGAPCPNCATTLAGPWCYACGQAADDYHRSLLRMTREAMGGIFDFDGRIWRTLPDLFLQPARLTRAYLDGHRVTQVPPFRLFLAVVVLVFLTAGALSGPPSNLAGGRASAPSAAPSALVSFDNGRLVSTWINRRIAVAARNPQAFLQSLSTWAQRLAFLALPISALLLGLTFFWRRDLFMFDHLIFSMHSLAFQGLLISTTIVAAQLSGLFWLLLLASPAHLFAHLKGTYRIGVFGTLARMVALFVGSLVGLLASLTGLVLIGLYEVGA
jgi:hypothetical protein